MRRAQSALRVAELGGSPGTEWEDFCFHCQQGAEKAIKAIFVSKGVQHRYTHSIENLLTSLAGLGVEIPEDIRDAATLSRFAGETRYPGVYERIDESDFRRALEVARRVVAWAKKVANL
jgi:HEPN domain-containing protein